MRPSGPGIRRVVTAALLLVLVASASGQGAERLAGGVSFYADFDQSVHAWYAVGEPAEQSGGGGTRLVPGLIGQAAQVGPAQGGLYRPLQYDAGRNIGTTGTLAFWINARFPWSRPGVSRTEETYRVLLNVPGPAGNFGFLLYHHEWPGTGPSSLYFCTYGLRPDHQSYSPAYEFPADSPWSPGEWHHLAWVWTPRLKQIYLDGNKVAEDDTPWQDDSFRFESPMTLGLRPGVESSSYVPAAATFDEWTIWNRTLSAEEVRQVHDLGKGGESLRDALSLAETQSAAKSRPPAAFRTGNLIPNGSFETWLRGGWIVEGLDDFAPPVELDGTPSPPDGRACARVPLRSPRPDRPPGGVILRQQLFQAKAGEPITLSAWARSDAPGATMDLRVWPSYVEASTRPTSRAFPLTREWQRYGFTLTPTPAPWDAYFPEIGLTATSEGTVWLDAVQVEPGAKISPFRPYEPVEAGLVTDQPANLFLAGEPVRVRLALSLATPSDLGGLELRLLDYQNEPVLTQAVPMGRVASGRLERDLTLPLTRTGAFRVEVWWRDRLLEEAILSVVPKPRTDVTLATTSAGAHWVLNREHTHLMRRLGIRWARIHDCSTITWWATVEPERGRFVFNDEPVKALAAEGCQALGVLSWSVPNWARDESEDMQFPFHLDDWARYVEATVAHFRPWIKCWEVWNEAGGGPSPDRYRELLRVSREAVKRADPEAIVVAPCTFVHCGAWNQRVLVDQGGLADTDLFSFHYGGWDPVSLGQMSVLARSDGKPRAVWNTETNEGFACQTFYTRFLPHLVTPYIRWMGKPRSAAELADIAPRLLIANRAAGVDRIFYYWLTYERGNLAGPRLTSWCGFEFDGSLRPRTASLAVAFALLDGASFERTLDWGPDYRAYLFTRGPQAIVALWREPKSGPAQAALRLRDVSPALTVCDLMGNPVAARAQAGTLELPVGPAVLYLQLPAREAPRLGP